MLIESTYKIFQGEHVMSNLIITTIYTTPTL